MVGWSSRMAARPTRPTTWARASVLIVLVMVMVRRKVLLLVMVMAWCEELMLLWWWNRIEKGLLLMTSIQLVT